MVSLPKKKAKRVLGVPMVECFRGGVERDFFCPFCDRWRSREHAAITKE